MMTLTPLLITLIMVIGFVMFSVKVMNKTVSKRRNYSYGNKVRGIFIGYIIILLICVILDLVAPNNKTEEWKKVDQTALEKERDLLYQNAKTGKIDQVNRDLMVSEWKFDYTDQKLKINEQDPTISVIVEKKKTNDNKVEAVYYRGRSSMNNLDITNTLSTPGLKITENQLILLKPEKRSIKVSEFANVFPVTQFTGEKMFEHHSDFYEDQGLLYIRIPKNLQLVGEQDINIEYVK